MDEEKIVVPYIVHEAELARAERRDKRQWIIIIALIVSLVVTNVAWLLYEHSFDTYSYSQDGDGMNNFNAGEQGDVIYEPTGESAQKEG